MSEKDVVYIEKNGPVAYVVLNQPRKKNAISAVMMDMLAKALDQLENDDEVKVIALRGEGDNFCAGGDLDQPGPKPMTAEFSRQSLRRLVSAGRAAQSPVKGMPKMFQTSRNCGSSVTYSSS